MWVFVNIGMMLTIINIAQVLTIVNMVGLRSGTRDPFTQRNRVWEAAGLLDLLASLEAGVLPTGNR